MATDVTSRRAVQYLRMSTEHQRYSLENQAAVIASYAREHGYKIVGTYSDEAKSGLRLRGRKQLQQLLSDALNPDRGFEAVLVLDVSRWGRFQDPDQAAYYEYVCRGAGVQVAYCAETFENDGAMASSLIKHIKRIMAGEYSRELSVKIHRAQLQQAGLGFKQGGPALYGIGRLMVSADGRPKGLLGPGEWKALHSDRVRFVLGSPEEIRVVRRIFQWFVRERMSFTAIAGRLNSRSVSCPSPTGRWSIKTVRTLLCSELYRGFYVYNRTTQKLGSKRSAVPQTAWLKIQVLPAIIGPRTFAAAQDLASRGHRNRYSDRQLLDALRDLLAREGSLTHRLLRGNKDVPHWGTYKARFGSLKAAFELIGYHHSRRRIPVAEWSDGMMLAELRRLALKYGYVSAKLIMADPRAPSPSAYQNRFGTMLAAYQKAGLPDDYAGSIRAGMARWKADRSSSSS